MTLIEVLAFYRDQVRLEGRKKANMFLREACEKYLWEHIQASVSDEGKFIDAYGEEFDTH